MAGALRQIWPIAKVISAGVALLPLAAASAAAAPLFELCPGFTTVTAIASSDGDYESIKTVESADADAVRIRYSAEYQFSDWLSAGPPELRHALTHRTIRRVDMESAPAYLQHFEDVIPELVPETTAISISREIFRKIKDEHSADFGIFIGFGEDKPSLDRDQHPNVYDNQMIATVTRAGDEPKFKVTVNNAEMELPTIRFEGDFYGDRTEFLVLDDPENPLILKYRIGIDAVQPLSADEIEQRRIQGLSTLVSPDKESLEVVKIATPCAAPQTGSAKPPAAAPGGAGGAGESPAGSGSGGAGAAAAGDGAAEAPAAPPAPASAPPAEAPAVAPPIPPPASAESAELEKQIQEEGSANVETIYFTVNSADIRPESEKTLAAIADVLKRHDDWRMSIDGHTDSQGDDVYNLDLSKRRAAAVKAALVARYAIDPGRMVATGHGKAEPIADNSTLEGRARNRRVELVRLPGGAG